MVATFSDSRSSVVNSSKVGKLVKSSGRCRNSATISTRTDAVIDSARPRSSSTVGSGSTRTASSMTTPSASPISVPGAYCRRNSLILNGTAYAATPEGGVTAEPDAA